MLKFILLGFLNYAPMTGYDLKSRMEGSTAHFWHAYHSQIYTTLRKLEKDGFLTSTMMDEEGSLTKREYQITEDGQEELRVWLQESMTEMPRVKEELLVRLFFSAQRDKEDVVDELRAQRQLHQQTLAVFESIDIGHEHDELADRDAFFAQRTLDFGIQYQQMYLEWLDETITLLDEQ